MDAPRTTPALARLGELSLLAMLLALVGILTAALVMQFAFNELPCPLCLLQRVGMFGVCLGIVLNFRSGFSDRNTAIAIAFALFLLIVSERQVLLDIYPRPGHAYIGTAVFGLHMPVWSVIIALLLLIGFAGRMFLCGGDDRRRHIPPPPGIRFLANAVGLYVLALGAVNFAAVVLQCGFNECHTFNYQLLS